MTNNLLAAGGNPSLGITNPVFKGTMLENWFLLGPTAFFSAIIPKIITLILIVGSIIFFFMLLIGGVQWISSGGDKAALEAAKGRITSALVGIVILFSAFAIIKLVETFFGVDLLQININPLIIQ